MELSRREAPLYGQVEAYISFRDPIVDSEETDFYVVLEGSTLTHVTGARSSEGRLGFTVPGHNVVEVVSVSPFSYLEDEWARPCGGTASLEYVSDVAQEVADYLDANRSRLDPQSHLELQRLASGGTSGRDPRGEDPASGPNDGAGLVGPGPVVDGAGLRELDQRVTEAMANMEVLQPWRSRPGEGPPNGDPSAHSEASQQQPRETLLHLAARQDLLHLCRFLLHQPNSHRALTLPNQEGDTPLHLAQRSREHTLFKALTTPPFPVGGRVVGGHCLWSDSSGVLRFHPGTDQLVLSAPRAPGPCPHDIITALRGKLKDPGVVRAIASLSRDPDVTHGKKRMDQSDGDLCTESVVEQQPPGERVFTEPLVLCLDDEQDTEDHSLLPVAKEDPVQSNRAQDLSALCVHPVPLDGTDVLATENTHPSLTEQHARRHIGGVTTDSSGADFSAQDQEHPKVAPCSTDTPSPTHQPLQAEDRSHTSAPPPPPLARPLAPSVLPLSGELFPGGSDRPTPENLPNRKESPTLEVEDLSPSLVALELDSEEDGTAGPQPPFSDLGSAVQNGPGDTDAMDTFDPSPELTCTRTKSASSVCEATPAQESCDQGVRLRSYSYSSSKLSQRPPGVSRDSPPPASSPG